MTTSAVPVEGVPYSQSSSAQTGGDFRVALHTDGTVRAKLVVANWGPMVSYNVPLRYVGTYQLDPSGQFRTSDLTITGNPRTYRKFEQLMAKMKMAGQYVQQQDTLNVHLETFNSQQNRWWSKGQKALTRATKRRTYVFGAKGTQDGTSYVGGKGR